jgi:hypothetical protein
MGILMNERNVERLRVILTEEARRLRYLLPPETVELLAFALAVRGVLVPAVLTDYWNVGSDGRVFRADTREDSLFTAYVNWLTARGGPLQADSGRTLTAEIKEHAEAWDVDSSASALRSRPVLLISTTANPYHATFTAALDSAGARKVTAVTWKSDHSFSALRIKLARTVVQWLHRSCAL